MSASEWINRVSAPVVAPSFCVACRAQEFHADCSLVFPLDDAALGFAEPARAAVGRAGLDLPFQGNDAWLSVRSIALLGEDAPDRTVDDSASTSDVGWDEIELD